MEDVRSIFGTVLVWQAVAIWMALFAFGCLYAWFVYRWLPERKITFNTAWMVVLGSLMTILGIQSLVGWHSLVRGYEVLGVIVSCFVASGLPMLIGYSMKESSDKRRDEQRSLQYFHNASKQFIKPSEIAMKDKTDE